MPGFFTFTLWQNLICFSNFQWDGWLTWGDLKRFPFHGDGFNPVIRLVCEDGRIFLAYSATTFPNFFIRTYPRSLPPNQMYSRSDFSNFQFWSLCWLCRKISNAETRRRRRRAEAVRSLTANLFVALRKIILPLAIHPMSDKIMEITTLAPDGSSLLVVWHFWLTELKTSDSGGQGFTDKEGSQPPLRGGALHNWNLRGVKSGWKTRNAAHWVGWSSNWLDRKSVV